MQNQTQALEKPLLHSISDTRVQLGGTSPSTIYRLIGAGRLEAIKVGERTYSTDESIRALVNTAPRLHRRV